MAEGQDAAKITVTVKTPKTKEKITVDENAEIKDVSTQTYHFHKTVCGNRCKLLRKTNTNVNMGI